MADINTYKNFKNPMETLRKVLKYLPDRNMKLKTIPNIFRKTYDENFLSDFLAYILNPKENGIGLEPLIKLIEDYSKQGVRILESLTLPEINSIEVIREYSFDDGKRIDIIIEIKDKMVIAIENKIYSKEYNNQTKGYANSIKKEFQNHEYILLFLTPLGNIPSSSDFSPISYKKLIEKLKEVEFDYRKDIRKKVIYDEFILHVEEYIMNRKSENVSDQTKLYLEYIDVIETLTKYYENDSNMVYEKFESIIRSSFDDSEYDINIKYDRSYDTIQKKSWKTKGLFIHYEFWISSKNILRKDKIGFMLEVEQKYRDEFLNLFDEQYESLKSEYEKRGILYRPEKGKHSIERKHAIAYKELDNYFKVGYEGENNLIDEIENFKFLEEIVENVLEKFKNKILVNNS